MTRAAVAAEPRARAGRPPLVLASASPRRAEILREAGFEFAIAPATVDEAAVPPGPSPAAAAVRIARAKAWAVARTQPGAAVLAADTLVVLDGEFLGKPDSPAEAARMLRALRGRAHTVVTGVVLAWRGRCFSGSAATRVHFRDYSDAQLARYVESGSPLDKAGAYGIQDSPFSPARAYDGCYLNVVGLPLCVVYRLLGRSGLGRLVPAGAGCRGHSPASRPARAPRTARPRRPTA